MPSNQAREEEKTEEQRKWGLRDETADKERDNGDSDDDGEDSEDSELWEGGLRDDIIEDEFEREVEEAESSRQAGRSWLGSND